MALNIADLFEHAVDAVPDRVALICGDEQLTYAQLEAKANRLAHYLIDQGVKTDDHVGLYCQNSIEHVVAMLGIVKARAVIVNVNYRYVEGELRYLFDNSDMVAAGARAPLRRPGRQRAAGHPERQDDRGRRRTTAPERDNTSAYGGVAVRGRAGAGLSPSATSASAAPTTSTSSTPAAPPASPRA